MTSQKLKKRKKWTKKIVVALKKLFPKAKIALKYKNNWELLVAVILSAQCTDKKVNEVTEKLFKKYKTLDDYVKADRKEFEKDVRSTGFYRNKAKNILAAAKIIKEKFGGKIPRTMEEILTLPGVARKTANVVLGNAYGVVEGIAVDTHVWRLSRKFDLTDYDDPVKIERDLMKLLPKKEWFDFTYRMIEYGRKICPARKHNCSTHQLSKIYPSVANRWCIKKSNL
ncbi:endonuclease III [Candidatus Wolfebacteria bacterium RIFCSPLOWO2_01_FULL_45_19]|uniref:Endonuclease III n=1 Tax=Candidatus Wolfebacteria bacterium RIFCSPLOWO2_01_FULL_45_19 TaxID=1802557 RepID=A0A1F8DSJ9_9BACT|nr:MAG: Endonuclease III [Parcubacteria group bacterium GW2011_GWB1_45_9]OGM91432.1 MAG: endonuclease III [Candidatus Wolfebacteria bacterium RIFCSPLOWO2_01_FULL_45_19]